VIALLADFIADTGLRQIALRINSLGDATCRPGYRELLLAYLREHAGELCDEHRESYERNPLRVLDCKRPACRAVAAHAPKILDALCEPCATAFARVCAGLKQLEIAFEIDPSLVRGLDYYTRTTFEFASLALDSAQNAVGGGGRYDGLAHALGGPDTPGIGFAAGVERLLLAVDAEGIVIDPPGLSVFVVDLVGGDVALALTGELRRAGIACDRAFDARSLKAQLTQADRSGAGFAIIIGQRELDAGLVTVRSLRGSGDDRQEQVARDALLSYLEELLK
jgi:histidyl-tRNA synthetase